MSSTPQYIAGFQKFSEGLKKPQSSASSKPNEEVAKINEPKKKSLFQKAANIANTVTNFISKPLPVALAGTDPAKSMAGQMAQGTIRTVAKSALGLYDIATQKKTPTVVELSPKASPLEQKIHRGVYGMDRVPSFTEDIVGAEDWLKGKGAGKASLPLAFTAVAGMTVADLTTGGKSKVVKELALTKDMPFIARALKGLKVAEKDIEALAPLIRDAKTVDEVTSILTKGAQKTKAITSTFNPLAKVNPVPGTKTAIEGTPKAFNAAEYVQELTQAQGQARKAEKPGIVQKAKNILGIIKSKLVDSNAPIEDILAKSQKENKYSIALPSQHISNQIDRVYRTPTLAGQFAKDKGFEQVIKGVDDIEAFDQYLIAKHAQNVSVNGIETGRNLAKDKLLIESLAPKYEAAAQKVYQYSRDLLDYSVDSGLISKELADSLKIKYPQYVPLQRIFSELEQTGEYGGGKAVASLSKQTVVQGLKGSKREIESPIESLLAKTNDAFMQGEKNKTARILAAYEKLPGNPFSLRELPKGESASHTISFMDNGVKRTFETTKEVAEAAKALNVQQLGILGRIFTFPVRVARAGITGLNVPFILANVARDQVYATIISKNALKTSVANPSVWLKALFSAVKHDELYEAMVRSGGGGTSFDISRNQVAETVGRIRASRNIGSRIKYTIRHPSELLRAVENAIGRSEEATRLQQFAGTKQDLLKQGLDEGEATIGAAKAARENTVNFARRGEWGTVLNSTFLYLNAGIQGSRTTLRALKNRPLQTSAKIATTLFMPVSIATAWNLSDEERRAAYEDIAEYEKEGNLIIVPPNPKKDKNGKWNIIKIPLPQGLNKLTRVVTKGIEQAHGIDALSFGNVAQNLIGTVSPVEPNLNSAASTLIPQTIRPTVEGIANYNFFQDRAQVPTSLEKLSPELQVKDNTSGTARLVGKALNISPIKVQEWIKGSVGGVGEQTLNASDRVLAGLDIIPKDQIGGRGVIDAVLYRVSKATGGESENKDNKKLKDILTNQADESFRIKQEAEILDQEFLQLSKEEANKRYKEIKEKNPLLAEKIKDVAEDRKLGLSYQDRLIKQLGVKNGERARYIHETVKSFSTKEEKNAYIKELREKKVISDEVLKQLKEIIAKGD